MKQGQDDVDLRTVFRELRDDVESSAPSFVLKPKGTTRRRPAGMVVAVVGAAAAVAVFMWTSVVDDGLESLPGLDLNTVAWAAPTDFLLDTPGRDFLRTLPTFGGSEYTLQSSDPEGGVADTAS